MTFEEMGEEPPAACKHCGCTSTNPCTTPTGPCQWVDRNVCSGFACVDLERQAIAAAAAARSQITVVGGELLNAQGQPAKPPCLHRTVSGSFVVAHLEDTGVSIVELTVFCADCSTPFKFLGDWPAGVNTLGFASNVERTEVRLAACPVDAFPDSGVEIAPAAAPEKHLHAVPDL